jgi:hypothetical protein
MAAGKLTSPSHSGEIINEEILASLNMTSSQPPGSFASLLNGIEPSPERARKTTWKEFLAQHWELIVAADFFTVEVWMRKELRRFIVCSSSSFLRSASPMLRFTASGGSANVAY